MKFRVHMKDTDVLNDAIADAVNLEAMSIPDEEERDAVREVRLSKVRKLCCRWFKYSEYLTVEVDTEAETCVVIPRGND